MPLTIYRRHSKKCPYHGKPRNSRNCRQCQQRCSIYVQGSLGGRYVRLALDLTYWEPAVELVQRWEKAGRIEGLPLDAVTHAEHVPATAGEITHAAASSSSGKPAGGKGLPTAEDPTTISVLDAVQRFKASLKTQNLAWETTRKYRTILNRLLDWCEDVGIKLVCELSVTRMDDFRGTWKDGPNYATKNLERLRAFFGFCVERDWIRKNSAKAVKAPQVDLVPTLPFSNDEMERIVAACDRVRGKENQDRMRAFVLTMRYSGLRISDMVALHSDQRVGTKLRLYTSKTGTPVFVPLPDFVINAMEKIERRGLRYFTTGKAKSSTDTSNWSGKLQSLFELAGVANGRSHRFRDTFSCSLLEEGVSVEAVAMLLGNTPAIVVKHYAPWIKSRQDAAEAAVRMTWQSQSAIEQANRLEGFGASEPPPAPLDSWIVEAFDRWIKQSASKHTRWAHRKDVESFICFVGIDWPIGAGAVLGVETDEVLRYRDELTSGGASRSYVARQLASISSWYQFLAAAAAAAVAAGEVDVDVVVRNPVPEFAERWAVDRVGDAAALAGQSDSLVGSVAHEVMTV